MSDAQERTEKATDKRMKEARSKGRLSKSTDLTAWVGVGAAAVMLPFTLQTGTTAAIDQLFSVRSVIESPDPAKAVAALGAGLGSIMATIGPLLGVGALAVVGAAAVQGGIHFKKLEGKYEQFNVVQGLGRVFGMRALWEGAKTLLKSGGGRDRAVPRRAGADAGAAGLRVDAARVPARPPRRAARAGLLQAAVGAGLVLAGARRARRDAPQPQAHPHEQAGGPRREQEQRGRPAGAARSDARASSR